MPEDAPRLSNAQTRDIEALLHPLTNPAQHRRTGPHLIERGEGIYVWDEQGRKLIEGLAGLWCAGLGFGDRELAEAAKEQMDRLPYYHLFAGRSYEPAIELAEKIKELYPRPMARVIYSCSGSEANDTQVKLAWYMMNARGKPEKKKIISRRRAYHGVTLVATSLTGLPLYHNNFNMPFDFVRHTTTPHYWREAEAGETEAAFTDRLVAELEALILEEGPETIAAMIAEPVMGAGGVIVPPEGYFEKVSVLLKKYEILFIDDEVICGFGRTGNWFGAETFAMEATSVSMAKQLTAAFVPLSAVAINAEMAEAIEAEASRQPAFGHGFTYGGHPLACAVGVKTLEIYKRRDILGHVRRVAPAFQAGLRKFADHPLVGEARGVGLMGALELSPDPANRGTFAQWGKVGGRFAAEMLERGVIVRNMGDIIGFCPPMVITADQIDELFAPVGSALDATPSPQSCL